MKIGIFGTKVQNEDRNWVSEFLDALDKKGHFLSIFSSFADESPYEIRSNKSYGRYQKSDDVIEQDLDFIISLGGDGTVLRCAGLIYKTKVPLVGINLGRLGFLASIERKDALKAVIDIVNNKYWVERRTLLAVESKPFLFNATPVGLNDFTVFKRDTSSMIAIHTFINGEFLNTYWSDGLIVATPTGSTGYSLSCGGPIVFPGSGNLVITPVATHNLNVRPLVVSDDSVITIELEGRTNSFLASLDSRFERISGSQQLAVRKSEHVAKIIQLNNYSYPETLRRKLTWGIDKRTK